MGVMTGAHSSCTQGFYISISLTFETGTVLSICAHTAACTYMLLEMALQKQLDSELFTD